MEEKKKILHIIPSLIIGGAEVLLLHTIKMFPEYEHHVITFHTPDQEFYKRFSEVAIIHRGKTKRILSLRNLFFLRRIEKKVRPIVIHAHLLQTNWLSRLAFASRKNLVNSIHSPYGKDAFGFHSYTVWMEKYTNYLSKAVLVFVSNYVKEDYAQYIDLKREHFVLQNFVPDVFFNLKAKLYTPGQPLHLVAVGNIKLLKNYGLLIEAFKQLKHLPIYLDVYGTGDLLETYKEEADRYSLHINFKGSVGSVLTILGNYHAFLFPSQYEGFSNALLEAMSAEMPLILSDIHMFRKLAKQNAYFFHPDNAEVCTGAILKMYQEGFPARAISENKQFVLENFTETIYRKKLENIYFNKAAELKQASPILSQ